MGYASGQQFGDYRLGRMIGDGEFAEVYEADHIHLPGDKAAIKLLKGGFTPHQIEELRCEALMVSKLNHPHIIQLRTFSVERSIPYLVMTYAQGGTLKQKHPQGTRLALSQILTYVHPIATALQYAHEQRIVHRDLKPANILLTQDGRIQVADFGIAVMSHSSRSRTMQEIIGTWVYMAPEQFNGRAEPASDQYALAIMVYQWLCGYVPFDGNGNMYLISKQQENDPPPSLRAKLPDLLPAVEEVIMKALAKDPKQRFASIMEFAAALEETSHPPFVIAPGRCLGDYKLIRKLGEGSFAVVYEAEHLQLLTRAAIKLLKGTFTAVQVEGLRQEARAIIQLDHPHIIRAYGFSLEGNVPYLIMAYAPNGSLASQYEKGTSLLLSTILEYTHQIASALQYTHDLGIIHRDIKPENILIDQDRHLQVADFGIAAMASQNTLAAQEVAGSWTYMAPEQFEGKAEPASDQYALGIMVYQWLCGDPPFTGNGSIYAIPYQHMNEPPPSLCDRLPGLFPGIEQAVMRSLAKRPAERFDSVLAFAQALEDASTKTYTITGQQVPEHLRKKAQEGQENTEQPDESMQLLQTAVLSSSILPTASLKDFFISYNKADREWANWVASCLQQESYSFFLPPVDFREGFIFKTEMQKALTKAKQMIVILSPNYMNALKGRTTGIDSFRKVVNRQKTILAVCIYNYERVLEEIRGVTNYIDITGEDGATARAIFMAYIRGDSIELPTFTLFPSNPVVTSTNETPLFFTSSISIEKATLQQPQGTPLAGKTQTVPPLVHHRGIEVFFSYSHKDEEMRKELEKHLSNLKRQRTITGWHDGEIRAGNVWEEEIDAHLKSAHIILLLISTDFLNSSYCYEKEMIKAMDRHKAGDACVIPVLLRPTHWERTPFGRLQVLPSGAKPITRWEDRDEAYVSVAKGIQRVIDELTKKHFDRSQQITNEDYNSVRTKFTGITDVNFTRAETQDSRFNRQA